MADDEKKIIVDEDWKKQAQKEKEILAEKEKALEKEESQQPESEQSSDGHGRGLPAADFAGLVNMFATQAMLGLGLLEIKGQGPQMNLEMAKYNIDTLGVLEEKTKGNLTEQEENVLRATLADLRMAYVKISEMAAKQAAAQQGEQKKD